LLLCLLLFSTPSAFAADVTTVTVRSGNHPGFGRVVFDAPSRVTYRLIQDGEHASVSFANDTTLTGTPPLPQNVVSVRLAGAVAELVIAAGTTLHHMR